MIWTDEKVELLKKLRSDGLSAKQIALEFGGVSRNGILGKAYRLGIAMCSKSPRKPRARGIASFTPDHIFEAAPATPKSDIAVPAEQRCSIYELSNNKCRWPIGDPRDADFFFCGGATGGNPPYCGPHACVAYKPVTWGRPRKRTVVVWQP